MEFSIEITLMRHIYILTEGNFDLTLHGNYNTLTKITLTTLRDLDLQREKFNCKISSNALPIPNLLDHQSNTTKHVEWW